MKIISCAGYYGTGSSAVTDFVSEFENVKSFGDTEFRFVHDPDGIADLEYNLVENFNRHNSGYAVKRFMKLIDLYSGNIFSRKFKEIFGDSWEKCAQEYINSLVDFTYHGWGLYDLTSRGKFFYFRKRLINKILHMTVWRHKPEMSFNNMKKEITYCAHPSEAKFIECTKRYIGNLFDSAHGAYDIVMADQIVPPSNIERYLRYFDDIKVVIVDRDPRDVYLSEKYLWNGGKVPPDAETFCKWFKYTRENGKHRNINSEQVHFIMFEDLIYKYEETSNELTEWLGLSSEQHKKKKEIFVPEESKKNTRLWEQIKCDMSDIHFIVENLAEYLYEI